MRGLLGTVVAGCALLVSAPLYAQTKDRASPSTVEHADREFRPWYELGAQAGLNQPSGADEVRAGPSVGGVALLRPVAGLGIGAGVEAARFAWLDDDYILAWTYSLRLRLYAAFENPLDIYAEALAGRTSLDDSRNDGHCNAEGGVTLGLGVGVDRYVSKNLRLGGVLAYASSHSAVGCDDMYRPNAPPSVPDVSPGVALRITATFGGSR